MSIIFYRKKAAAAAPAGDNYSWRERWLFGVSDKSLSNTVYSTTGSGFDTADTYSVTVSCSGTVGASAWDITNNKLRFRGRNNSFYAFDGALLFSTTLSYFTGESLFIREADFSSNGGMDRDYIRLNYRKDFLYTSGGYGFNMYASASYAVNVQPSTVLYNNFDPVRKYDIALVVGGVGANGLIAWFSGTASNTYALGAVGWIKSRTGTEFPTWERYALSQQHASGPISHYMCMQNYGGSTAGVAIAGIGRVSETASTFFTLMHQGGHRYADDMQDVNNTLLTNHTSTVSNITWSGGNFEIFNNQAQAETSGNETFSMNSTDPGIHVAFKAGAEVCRPAIWRYTDDNNYFAVEANQSAGSFSLIKVSAGSRTVLAGPSGSLGLSLSGYIVVNVNHIDNISVNHNFAQLFDYFTSDSFNQTVATVGMGDDGTKNMTVMCYIAYDSTIGSTLSAAFDNAIADLA